jgi:predicted HD phosphohydrolase
MSKLIEKAKAFATRAHDGQMYGDKPFIYHPGQVAKNAERFGFDEEVIAAAWLHDAIEDTDTTYHDIKQAVGKEVAELVYAVTDELGRNRRERAEKTLPKTRLAGSRAVGLKLCDRLANAAENDRFLGMYRKEYPDFRRVLFAEGEHATLWYLLDTAIYGNRDDPYCPECRQPLSKHRTEHWFCPTECDNCGEMPPCGCYGA